MVFGSACIPCCNEIFSFGILTNKNFLSMISSCNPTTIKNSDANHIELINSRKSNIIVGYLYKRPSMDVFDFNENYLNSPS